MGAGVAAGLSLGRAENARKEFAQFCRQGGGSGLRQRLLPPRGKPAKALLVRNATIEFAKIESFVMKAFQLAGYETLVAGKRQYDYLRYDWLAGNKTGYLLSDFDSRGDPEWVNEQLAQLTGLSDLLALQYHGVHVGRFAAATSMRYLRSGRLDLADPSVRATVRGILASSVRDTRAAARLLEEVKPERALFMDRGYSGYGEAFDLAIGRGIDSLTWNLGYRSDRLSLRRYNAGNHREHHLAPSDESWRRICAVPWKQEYGQQVRQELFQCYENQDWFHGTQFGKTVLPVEATREKLGLSRDKKIAIIFPHIFWDGSFFYGEDLFEDYTDWFIETIRAAAANPRLQWVIKIHPVHVFKVRKGVQTDRPSELEVIDQAFGRLPGNLTLIYPDTDISTYSLFQLADYAVTVRGTVGIECALFGIPTVTAGTGRYDRRGFTLDSSTREEYLRKLDTLETYPRLSGEQVELAERYGFAVFLSCPLRLSSLSLDYERDAKRTPRVTVHPQTREQWLTAPDVKRLASWIADGKAEDMLELPECARLPTS